MTSLISFFIWLHCATLRAMIYDFSKLTEVMIAGICNIVASQNIENVSYL